MNTTPDNANNESPLKRGHTERYENVYAALFARDKKAHPTRWTVRGTDNALVYIGPGVRRRKKPG